MVRNSLLAVMAVVLMALAVCDASEIVVLTETPVAEFTLPDGSVLTNAYVWRRSAQGLMIMHDGGSHFLNFQLLPAVWQAAYLGVSSNAPPAGIRDGTQAMDKYKLGAILERIPDLGRAARLFALSKDAPEEVEKQALSMAMLQSLLSDNRAEAKRLALLIEEKQYAEPVVERDLLFAVCGACAGSGQLSKTCKTCNGSGKCRHCEGKGTRQSELARTPEHCSTCRGTGNCRDCNGKSQLTPACLQCGGSGKVLNRTYCETRLTGLVREINALASGGRRIAITASNAFGAGAAMAGLPSLAPKARAFYLSEAYTGELDADILAACVLKSLLADRPEDAKRFLTMRQVDFPDDVTFVIDDYIKPCEKCGETGKLERECSACGGQGKCTKCDGKGERMLEIDPNPVHCTTCRGTGKCHDCGGDGILTSQCLACGGRGRYLDQQRAQIKLGLLAEKLNSFAEGK